MPYRMLFARAACGCLFVLSHLLVASAFAQAEAYSPGIAPASDEGQKAIARFRVPEGLKIELFAAEPMLANPVAFCIDDQGKFYVAETFRHFAGVTDTRRHMYWLDDDLACRTVEDRVAKYRKWLKNKFESYGVDHDRVRLIEDRDHDGKADQATVFADGFKTYATGIGAGVLARDGDVYYSCIPDLWKLRDTDGDGHADQRESLHYGFGVHTGFLGHDLHGLIFGPDGRLYFSIGDRGINVKTKEGSRLEYQDTGTVLRCNPDGTELEVFAYGLRNPQELAFDQYGNLFTGDNNSDGGDQARWVYVVEGGDSGWRIGYQFHNIPTGRGPWNAEKLWHPQSEGQAAYLVPPLANLADGPSGLCYYPGTGLPERYAGHFFLCDFRGGPGNSGIRSLAVKPKGASFEVVDHHQFLWGILVTDCCFGTDSSLYVTDWVDGWDKPGKGRIYRLSDPQRRESSQAAEVQKLLAAGMRERKPAELGTLLGHADMRIRQRAQFELARRGDADSLAILQKTAADTTQPQLARVHAVWGLGQIGRRNPKTYTTVLPLLADEDEEVRAQAIRVLGDGRIQDAQSGLLKLMAGTSRDRFLAGIALGRLKQPASVPAVVAMLRANDDKDPYLRHAGVMALLGTAEDKALAEASADASAAVRMAALLTYRRRESAEVARFLSDAEPRLVLEAARAINDVPITGAFPQLAALSSRQGLPDEAMRRAINANFRLGRLENAKAVAQVAGRSDVSQQLRWEAVLLLSQWAQPSGRDHVMGLWRPLEPRDESIAKTALQDTLASIVTGPPKVKQEAIKLAARFGIKEVGPVLLAQVQDANADANLRVEALTALAVLKDQRLEEAVKLALDDKQPAVRAAGVRELAARDLKSALPLLEKALDEGEVVERQQAASTLSALKQPAADALLVTWLDRLVAGQVPGEMQLDLLEAARARNTAEMKKKLAAYEAGRNANNPLSKYRESLVGGNAARGRQIFLERADVSCQRCHKLDGNGGRVGPELTGIGLEKKRDYLLEALVAPNKSIAKGYESVIVQTADGQTFSGVLREETPAMLKLVTAEGRVLVIPTKDIDERVRGKSPMPDQISKFLSPRDLRDLVEFLSNLKTKPQASIE